jgi:hypothetical protein
VIRRWSCIINITNNFSNFNQFNKLHKIILFKSSVNFKRFSFKITKFKRRSLMRLKHRSSFLIYTNIFKYWVKDFMFNKLYLKYQFFNNIFINNFFFYNFNFIKNKSESFFYNFNFIFTTLTNKKFFYFSHKKSLIKNSSLIVAWFVLKPDFNVTVLPIYNNFQNSYFPYQEHFNVNFNLNEIFDLFFKLFLKKNIEINRIISLLFSNKIL